MFGLGWLMLGPCRAMLVAYVGPMSDPSIYVAPKLADVVAMLAMLSQNNVFSKKAVSSRRERHFEVMFALLGVMMPPCWDYIGLYWDQVGPCWSLGHVGATWGSKLAPRPDPQVVLASGRAS